jgi:hypothetical protein
MSCSIIAMVQGGFVCKGIEGFAGVDSYADPINIIERTIIAID